MVAGRVVVADDEAFIASTASVTIPEVRVGYARLVVVSSRVVSPRSASKLLWVMELCIAIRVGIGLCPGLETFFELYKTLVAPCPP